MQIRVAIAGLGTVGRSVAHHLSSGIPGLKLTGVAARDHVKARTWLDTMGIRCPIISLDDMPQHADLAVECAPGDIIEQICRPMLASGKKVMVLSAGAL